jgi:PIN domain nuclease of toxin-antitoxin system
LEGATSVLDASALLAYLNDEAGAQMVEESLVKGSAISAVNLAEVLSKLAEVGEDPQDVSDNLKRRGLLGGKLVVAPLGHDDAVVIARLHSTTRAHGLSLGDRACLGLALRLRVPALTADRAWSRLKISVKVVTVR